MTHEFTHIGPVGDALAAAADASGLPADNLATLMVMFLCIPFGFVLSVIKSPVARSAFCLILGLAASYTLLDWYKTACLLGATTLGYPILLLQTPGLPTTTFYIACMMVVHWWFYTYDYMGYRMNVNAPAMMFCVKMSLAHQSYVDGRRLKAGKKVHSKDHIQAQLAERSVDSVSVLDYLSYIWYFGTLFTGPCFNIKEYLEFVRLEGDYSKKDSLHGRWGPLLLCVFWFFFTSAWTLANMMYFSQASCFTDWYRGLSLVERVGWLCVCSCLYRGKFYAVWYLSEAGTVASGLGVQYKKGVRSHDRMHSGHWYAVELASSPEATANSWNTSINAFLKYNVYVRVPANKLAAMAVTRIFSALWHGVYPGYYVFFGSTVFLGNAAVVVRARITPYFSEGGPLASLAPVYNVLCIFTNWALMNTLGAAFILLRFDQSIEQFNQIYWLPHIVCAAAWLVTPFVVPRVKTAKKEE